MNALIRTSFITLVLGLLAVGVFTLRFVCSPWDVEEDRRREELRRLEEATFRRVAARRKAVQEYIVQRRTLTETMQRFQELDEEWPDYSTLAKSHWLSSVEQQYQHTIYIAKVLLQKRPEELATILRRLETDYRQLQADKRTPSPAATKRTESSR